MTLIGKTVEHTGINGKGNRQRQKQILRREQYQRNRKLFGINLWHSLKKETFEEHIFLKSWVRSLYGIAWWA